MIFASGWVFLLGYLKIHGTTNPKLTEEEKQKVEFRNIYMPVGYLLPWISFTGY
jgi:hypothetical protein